ncbi:hypothetical protein SK128_013335 [Halocaridina rubra]|uniref:CUB domain-containing protein n=1 Tax=Halocaridina rubra TaxID=373956 RepID=A0AAN8WFB5_HALRR
MRQKRVFIMQVLLLLLQQVSNCWGEHWNATDHHAQSKRASDSLRISVIECGVDATLANGESAIIYSDNDGKFERCIWKIQAPSGSKLSVDCPNVAFNNKGCKFEKFFIVDGTVKTKFCNRNSPNGFQSTTNSLKIKYKRKVLAMPECSGGFICQISAA